MTDRHHYKNYLIFTHRLICSILCLYIWGSKKWKILVFYHVTADIYIKIIPLMFVWQMLRCTKLFDVTQFVDIPDFVTVPFGLYYPFNIKSQLPVFRFHIQSRDPISKVSIRSTKPIKVFLWFKTCRTNFKCNLWGNLFVDEARKYLGETRNTSVSTRVSK